MTKYVLLSKGGKNVINYGFFILYIIAKYIDLAEIEEN